MTPRRILITGATGFIGANLVRRMCGDAHDVHIFLRSTSQTWRIDDVLERVTAHTVDLRDMLRVYEAVHAIRPQVIFHCAAAGIHGGKSDADDRGMFEANLFGTMNLIDACDEIDYECFVNTGSSSEYGPKSTPMKETDVCEPITAYGVAKCASTLYGSFVGKTKKKPILGFRIFSPYGPYDDSKRLIAHAVRCALEGRALELGDPKSVRDYYFIDDAVSAYLAAIPRAKGFSGEVFNIGSGHETSIGEVVKKILALTGSKSKVSWNVVPGRTFDTAHWRADIAKSSAMLGWSPTYSLEKGLEKTVAWFREHLSLYT